MKRSGFGKKEWTKPQRSFPKPVNGAFKAPQQVEYAGASIQKESVKSKPGKRAPTAEEKKWMDAIVQHGCICCFLDGNPPRPTAVHHILRGGQRIGHMYTLPLCDPGHHQNGQQLGLISRHPWKARFEAKYGTELELLTLVSSRIKQGL